MVPAVAWQLVTMDGMTEHVAFGLAPPDTPVPLLSSAVLIFTAFMVILFVSWLWPATRPLTLNGLDLHSHEAEQARIQQLILPTEALHYERADTAPPALDSTPAVRARASSVVQIVSQKVGLRSPHAPKESSLHRWTFEPRDEAARDRTPLLVFINRGSGGQQGGSMLVALHALLSPQQVVDLSEGQAEHAEQALQSFRTVGRFRVLVCGGDGTVSWVLSLLDDANLEYTPPVAILPFGTGNDLARALGWGDHHPHRGLIPILEDVDSAQVSLLDRWAVSFEHARVPKQASGRRGDGLKPARKLIMQNYMGVPR